MGFNYRATAEPYQKVVEDFIYDNKRCAVWAEMGLRKTAMTLAAIRQLRLFGEVDRVLVVAPMLVMMQSWPAELRKWTLFQELTYTTIRGEPSWRMSLTNRETDIHLINYEAFEWLANIRAKTWPYDMIVFDESDWLKSPEAVRFKVADKLIRYLDKKAALGKGKRPRVVQLTGTPSAQGLTDLWAQVHLLDQGAALGEDYKSFRMRWFESRGRYKVTHREGADTEIHEKCAHLAVSLSQEDYLRLPPKIINPVLVPLPEKCMAEYRLLETEALLELSKLSTHDLGQVGDLLEDDNAQVDRIAAFTAAAKMQKCQQYASGAVFLTDQETGEPTKEWREVHKAKLDALKNIIGEAAGAPVLVVYWYQHDLVRLMSAFPQARVLTKSPATIDAWNRGEVPIGLLSASAGHGLNLQDGGNILVWFSMVWPLRLFLQTNARLHRSGQGKPVFIHLLLAQGTIDEDIPERHAGNLSIQQLLMHRLSLLRREQA